MSNRKPRGYWMEKRNIIKELKTAMRKNGLKEIPTERHLLKLGYTQLAAAVDTYYGWRDLREELGDQQLRAPRNQWKDENYVFRRAEEIMEKEGWKFLPSLKIVGSRGYWDFVNSINRYHGGIQKVRTRLKQKNSKASPGTFKNKDYVEKQLKRIVKEHNLDALPSQTWLCKQGYSSLAGAISNYHGGFRYFRESMGEEQLRVEDGKWRDLEFTLNYAIDVMRRYNLANLPSGRKLRELGEDGLRHAVYKFHGGAIHFRGLVRQRSGEPTDHEPFASLLEKYVGGEDE